MEKFSSINRVVGNMSESGKEQILANQAERFNDQVFKDLEGKEKEKTSEELQIIALVNDATNELRQKYGLENFDIPANNIHIITKDNWSRDESALYASNLQAVALKETPTRIAFMTRIFHEMIHFKSYQSLQITNTDSPEIANYRNGLTVCIRNGEKKYFTNLNEAITEEINKRFSVELLDNPLFTDEVNKTKEVAAKYPQATTNSGSLLFNNDTLYAKVKGGVNNPVNNEKGVKITTYSFTYENERKNLNILIDRLYEKNNEIFKNRDEVFEVFAKGMMTGNILPVGRLIDGTFGHGTLRKIGELDQNIEEQEEFILLL